MKKTIAVLLSAVICVSAFAQGNSAMSFSAIPRDARTLAMGGVSNLKSLPVWGLGSEKFDVQAAYASWAPKSGSKSSDFDFNLLGKIGSKFVFNITGADFVGVPYGTVSSLGAPSGTFKPSDMVLGLGLGYNILSNLSLGVNLNYLKSNLAAQSSLSALSFDAVVAATFGDFKLAGGLKSFGTDVVSQSGSQFSLPTDVTLLGAYSLSDGQKSRFDFAAQIDYFLSSGFRMGLGGEYTFNEIVSARLGYNYGGKSVLPSFVSLGAGVKYSGFKLDLTYLLLSETVGGTFMVGLGYAF